MESRIDSQNNNKDSSIDEQLDKLAEDIKKLPKSRITELERIVRSMNKKALSIIETAEIIGVHKDTIRRAINSGSLKAFQLNKRGSWRISIDVVDKLLKEGWSS